MNRDTLTGIVGALVLVAAMAGVFFYERGQFHEYTITWEAGEENSDTTNGGPMSHGGQQGHTFGVPAVNDGLVKDITVHVTWDTNTDDEFGVDVTGPDGTTKSSRDTGGSVTVVVPVQDAPPATTIADRDPDAALAQVWNAMNETALQAGQGSWDIVVTLHDAMRPNEIEVLDPEEGENEYQLTFTRSTWEPVVD